MSSSLLQSMDNKAFPFEKNLLSQLSQVHLACRRFVSESDWLLAFYQGESSRAMPAFRIKLICLLPRWRRRQQQQYLPVVGVRFVVWPQSALLSIPLATNEAQRAPEMRTEQTGLTVCSSYNNTALATHRQLHSTAG